MVRTSKIGEEQGMSLTGKKRRDDIIAGKGNGLIMLLHGGPGTGKTLTAESVAEIAEMPLYNVTCGDIGTSAEAVEKYLQTVLVLGKTWNCVLLLDEADVFLEERTLSDLERNSLVSVFLRTLEYYDGILILTSNRVGTFDEAFKSRIQVALHYPNLDGIARKKIWKNFFDMMEADEEDVNLEELNKHIKELADQDMNGREIRNSLTTARQLALFQKETLAWEHVEQAIKTARDFNRYLGGLHGHTDDEYARDRELR
jgi:SpoVK/Ycf46/Vps4 family AAA+-type ATPase